MAKKWGCKSAWRDMHTNSYLYEGNSVGFPRGNSLCPRTYLVSTPCERPMVESVSSIIALLSPIIKPEFLFLGKISPLPPDLLPQGRPPSPPTTRKVSQNCLPSYGGSRPVACDLHLGSALRHTTSPKPTSLQKGLPLLGCVCSKAYPSSSFRLAVATK